VSRLYAFRSCSISVRLYAFHKQLMKYLKKNVFQRTSCKDPTLILQKLVARETPVKSRKWNIEHSTQRSTIIWAFTSFKRKWWRGKFLLTWATLTVILQPSPRNFELHLLQLQGQTLILTTRGQKTTIHKKLMHLLHTY